MRKLLLLTLAFGWMTTGCGKVSKSPIAPLIDPPNVYNDFNGSLNGFARCFGKLNGVSTDLSANPADLTGVYGLSLGNGHTYGGSSDAAKLDIAFGSVGDSFDGGYHYTANTDVGFAGKTISAWVYWDSGLTSGSGKVIAKFYGKFTDSWSYVGGNDATLVKGQWIQVIWSPSTSPSASSLDITKCREWGLEIYADVGPFTPGVVYIDHLAF